jgi:hypothetical protein
MASYQYHEPAKDFSPQDRTAIRIFTSLIEEAEAINWYTQRIEVESDNEAKKIIEDARDEEYKHFSMELEWLIRRHPKWQQYLKKILFSQGDIVQIANKAEKEIGS